MVNAMMTKSELKAKLIDAFSEKDSARRNTVQYYIDQFTNAFENSVFYAVKNDQREFSIDLAAWHKIYQIYGGNREALVKSDVIPKIREILADIGITKYAVFSETVFKIQVEPLREFCGYDKLNIINEKA